MRKQLKVLLLVATVAVLFVMAMIVGSATEVEVADGAALVQEVSNSEPGDIIKLIANITLEDTLVIDKPLTIDGGSGNFTITSNAADYIFDFVTEGQINLLNFNVTSANAGFIYVPSVNGTYVIDNVDVNCLGLFFLKYGKKNSGLYEGGYTLTVSNSTWTSTGASALTLISYSQYGVNEGVAPEENEYPVTATFTNVTINAATTNGHIFKFEGTALTLDSCTLNWDAELSKAFFAVYDNTWPSNVVIKGNSTFNCAGGFFGTEKASKYTIGRPDENDNITVVTNDIIGRFRSGAAGAEIELNGGTYTCNATTPLFASNADITVNINGANLISANGAALFDYEAAGNTSVANWVLENCEITFTGTTSGFMSAQNVLHTASYDYCVITVTAAPAGVALFGANETLGTVVVLAPVGTIMSADKTIDAYAQSVKYGGVSYKLASNIEGAFVNSAAAGASIRQDLSGLMFETQISKEQIDAIVTNYSVNLADLRFYTLIAPMDYVAAANGIFNKDALDNAPQLASVTTKYVPIRANHSLVGITDGAWDQGATVVAYSGILSNLQSQTRGYAAVAMIEFEVGGDTVTLYGNFSSLDNARSAAQVAALAQ